MLKTNCGTNFIVDPEDVPRVKEVNWYLNRGYVANRGYEKGTKKRTGVYLHHFVLGILPNTLKEKGLQIDHINGNKLDNRKENLRLVNPIKNVANLPKCKTHAKKSPSSKYKGVTYHKRDKRWQSSINVSGIRVHLGYFTSERAAALAYDSIAKEWFGIYGRFNFEK